MRVLLLLGLGLILPLLAWSLRLTPLPEVAARPAGSILADADLVDLSLVLSGVTPQALAPYRSTLTRWEAEFRGQIAPTWDEAKIAEELLVFLHTHLKGYSLYQTQVDILIDRGTFNCVSSAVVYMILGRDMGLDVQAVATSDHAFALVRLSSGRDVDVETTTKFGFDPGTKVGFTNSFGQTGFVYVPPGNYSQRTTVTDRQLLGLLVQNRMVEFQRTGRPEEAVGPAIDRWVVEGTPEAFRGMIDGFVNYGKSLNDRREFLQGLDLVDRMVVWTGPVDDAKQLAGVFVNNQVGVLLDRKDFSGAQALSNNWKNRGLLSQAQANDMAALIADNQLAFAVNNLPADQAAGQVEQAFAQGSVSAARRTELLSAVYGQAVQIVGSMKGPKAAVDYLKTLPADIQALPALVRARGLFEYNWGVTVHNRFVELWNSGKKDEGRQLLRDALAVLPDNPMLKKDLDAVKGL